jgi:hypothetical protein
MKKTVNLCYVDMAVVPQLVTPVSQFSVEGDCQRECSGLLTFTAYRITGFWDYFHRPVF